MIKKCLIIFVVTTLLSACSINQRVDPIANVNHENFEICIFENPDVREGFLAEMENVLNEKQIKYRLLAQLDANNNCEWTATYTANWAWDMALYMVYAEIKVFHNGKLDGEAIYDARMGGANMSKFIDAEPKIRELIELLLKQEQQAKQYQPSPLQTAI